MTWQKSIHAAVRELRKAEGELERELDKVRAKIDDLSALGGEKGTRSRARNTRRLSPAGRAAISKAAKRRWAKYRTEQRKAGR